MGLVTVEGARAVVRAAFRSLEARKQEVNNLNVYPVPDGDTGTNLSLTVKSILEDLQRAPSSLDADGVCSHVEEAALMGARGNSGVILSQMVRGAMEALGEVGELTPPVLAATLRRATETAYRAVRKPVEGTMLTVLREMAEAAEAAPPTAELEEMLRLVTEAGWDSVRRTPQLLKALADAGVVDAGGFGLVVLLEGMRLGQESERMEMEAPLVLPRRDEAVEHAVSPYLYCTSFLLTGENLDREALEEALLPLGDSLLVVGSPRQIKVHVHTDEPGQILALATARGILREVEIDNMKDQTAERDRRLRQAESQAYSSPSAPEGEVEAPVSEVVAVVAGDGIRRLYANLGVRAFVEGGQTMNPSAEEIILAVKQTSAPDVVILPNNKNIILAAEHVVGRVEGKTVHVLPTRSILGGLSALVAFEPDRSGRDNLDEMQDALKGVAGGEITRAVRDSKIDGLDIKKDSFIGLVEGKVVATGPDLGQVTRDVTDRLVSAESEIMTVLVGNGQDEAEARTVAADLVARYAELEVEVHDGGQPLYPILVSVE